MTSLKFKDLDLWLPLATLALIVIGLVILYTATFGDQSGLPHLFGRQLAYAAGGLILLILAASLSPRVHFAFSYLFYIICCLLLLGVLIWGDPTKGAARWINLGILSFQPSEPAKLALVLALARLVTDKKFDPRKASHLLRAAIMALIPLALVIAQPDLGTSIVFAAIFLSVIIAAGIPYAHLLILISPVLAALASVHIISLVLYIVLLLTFTWRMRLRLGLLVLIILANLAISVGTPQLWNQLKPYQKNRLVSFIHPEASPKGAGYQVIQSKVAIGSGGLVGKGLGQGSQTQLKFLPEQHTDFIFSVIGEELGWAGATVALALFSLLIYRGFRAAQMTKGRYSVLVCVGLISMLTTHIFINIGMTVGLMPVTGLPLPLLSYGGSFLWTILIAIGLILGIQRRWKEYTP